MSRSARWIKRHEPQAGAYPGSRRILRFCYHWGRGCGVRWRKFTSRITRPNSPQTSGSQIDQLSWIRLAWSRIRPAICTLFNALSGRNVQNGKSLILALVLGCGSIFGCDTNDKISRSNATAPPPTTQSAAIPSSQTTIVFDFDGPLQSDGLPFPWKCKVIRGNLGVGVTSAPELEGHHALQINCMDSHFIIYDESRPFDPKEFPVLSWKWKAEILPTGGDVRTHDAFYYSSSNHNDKVLQVLVGFGGIR